MLLFVIVFTKGYCWEKNVLVSLVHFGCAFNYCSELHVSKEES